MEAHSNASLNRMTVSQLRDICQDESVPVPEKALKKDLIELLRSNSAVKSPAKSPQKAKSPLSPTNDKTLAEAVATPGGKNYSELVTDAFGYISPEVTASEFQAHYRSFLHVLGVEALAMLLCPFPKSSEEVSAYDPYVDKFNSSAFHQATLHWLVFLHVIPLVVAAVMGDRNTGSAYSTLIYAVTRYLIVYLDVPVTSTTFEFLPIKLFTATCGILVLMSFWTHASWVESPAMMNFGDDWDEESFDDDEDEDDEDDDEDDE